MRDNYSEKATLFSQLTRREIEGCCGVGDEIGESSLVVSPQYEMIQDDFRHEASHQPFTVALRQPAELHKVVISEVRDSLRPHDMKVTLSGDTPQHGPVSHCVKSYQIVIIF